MYENLLCVRVDVDFASRHFKTAATVKPTASHTLKSYFCGSRLRLLTFFHKVRRGFTFSGIVAESLIPIIIFRDINCLNISIMRHFRQIRFLPVVSLC